jgi:hypothetical protein
MVRNVKRTLMYHNEPLLVDNNLAQSVMKGICQ